MMKRRDIRMGTAIRVANTLNPDLVVYVREITDGRVRLAPTRLAPVRWALPIDFVEQHGEVVEAPK